MCNFIDTPGMNHFEKERAKYMNSGDAAILVIAASRG
jgi:translation elongation factor EF-1alpha